MTRSQPAKILLIAVLIAPMMILLGMAAQSVSTLKTEPTFILPIEGYDPRDPVYGHYFQFQISWPWHKLNPISCSNDQPEKCRVCFMDNGTHQNGIVTPVIAVIPEHDIRKQKCVATVDGINYFGKAYKIPQIDREYPAQLHLQNVPHRFYIDEKHGKPLEDYFRTNPADFAIQVKIHNNAIHVEKLLIEGRDYRETLR
ncbi:MAG TPA: GDYXXLXY domain-containing protein [Alphaproteobacteria bacterium]